VTDSQTPRQKLLRRKQAMWNERSSWTTRWRDMRDYMLPDAGQFYDLDRDRGENRHIRVLDNTGQRSLAVLAAGLMAGMTSPARPWFRLTTTDSDLMESEAVKLWMHRVTRIMREIFARSNTYRALHQTYEELGAFGTGVSFIKPNFNTVLHHMPLTVGSYALAANADGVVDTLVREIPMTVEQLVGEFGLDNVCAQTKNRYERHDYDTWLTVYHEVSPRKDRQYGKRDAMNKPFKSCYYEATGDGTNPLRESGFDEFPALASRWVVRGASVYGSSPGREALGDIISLQNGQFQKAKAIDYKVDPPLSMPAAMKNDQKDLLPGGITYYTGQQPDMIRSIYEPQLDLQHMLLDIQDMRERIRSSFYVDLFMMLANDTRSGITATEVAERHEEKLLMLGPVLERLHNELLSPKIDITFAMMVRAGIVPTPPPELQGMDLKVEFVSTLAQAQRAVGLSSVDRLLGTVGNMAALKPDVMDKLDTDQIVDTYSDMLGVDPDLIVADEKVALIRQQRAEMERAAQQAEQAAMGVQMAEQMSRADTSGKNALTDVMAQFQGYS